MMPTRATEETTQSSGPGGSQTVSTKRTEGATQVAQETATSASGPGGTTVSKERMIGVAPQAAKEYSTKKTIFHAYQIIWYLLGFIEIVLAFRFVLKLLGANPDAGFTNFVYALSTPFAGPFLDMFRATANTGAETTSYFEWSTLVAAVVYGVVAWGVIKIFKLGKPTNPNEVVSTVDSE